MLPAARIVWKWNTNYFVHSSVIISDSLNVPWTMQKCIRKFSTNSELTNKNDNSDTSPLKIIG